MQLHVYRIIQYMPQKDKPQLFIPSNRVAAEYLTIDKEKYQRRKEAFARRTDALSGYILMQTNCRSSSIANYFGDEAVQACGICDNCLNEKRKAITPALFEKIEGRITGLLKQQNFTSADLMQQLEGFHKETTWQVLQFMQAENRIEVDKDGFILLK
jgi:ATP-dependent DNA helicase RecQ